ncbi:CaiB/BaiF CoA-transferase family protein [Propylenella binzhouense]|uniref:CoA transferase n=1 Tax=Propylenella binzhouense TaxID=2555902 RepID=A0A964T245_9HYPH|nr:CoA transferase [Propylenella binzhouense]MYZ46855.1 CoA transferase [Propylenella binzhouense]
MSNDLLQVISRDLLCDLKVVEVSHSIAGAYCGKVLADLGAEVTRFGPDTAAIVSAGTADALQEVLHGSKACEPLENVAGHPALAAANLVIIETGGTTIGYPELVNDFKAREGIASAATLIVITPAADIAGELPGCGLTSAAWGSMSWAIGERSRMPLTLPYDIADYLVGVNAAAAAALAAASPAKSGRDIEVSGRDVLAYIVGMLAPHHLAYGRPWSRSGRRPSMSGGVYPCGLFSCSDGYVVIYCRSNHEWRGILAAMGDPEWSREERFSDPRVVAREHADEADSHLLPWLARHSQDELMALALDRGFAVGPVKSLDEVLGDRQFAHRQAFEAISAGRAATAGSPVVAPRMPWLLKELDTSQKPHAAPVTRPPADCQPQEPSSYLGGLRVLDLSWVWSGPMVTSILVDFGAEVLKIEHPSHLDSVRLRGRPIINGKPIEGPEVEVSPWFNQLNHGKRSVTIDIKSPEGQEQIRRLAASCDVVVENMRPGVLDRLNIGYRDLAAANPGVIMLSMSMVGQTGPLSQMKGYAGIMSSMAGLESLVGYVSDGGEPDIVGMMMTALGDPNAAIHATTALLSAIVRQRRTGRGCWIDLSQIEAMLSVMPAPLLQHQVEGDVPILGNRHTLYAPHGHFPCKGQDSWTAICIRTDEQWRELVDKSGSGGLARFRDLDSAGRLRQVSEIESAVAEWTSGLPRDQLVNELLAIGVAAAPVNSFEDMTGSAWKAERAFTMNVKHPFLGTREVFIPPWRFDGRLSGVNIPAPILGADTAAVLDKMARDGGAVRQAVGH